MISLSPPLVENAPQNTMHYSQALLIERNLEKTVLPHRVPAILLYSIPYHRNLSHDGYGYFSWSLGLNL